MSNIKYLFKVEASCNNNKYYKMTDCENGTFLAEWGREGSNPQTKIYPLSQWDKKYKEKIKKEYQDVTDFKSVKKIITQQGDKKISDDKVVTLLVEMLQKFALATTNAVYKVEAKDVTQAQIDAAQHSVNNLSNSLNRYYKNNWDVSYFNNELQKLFVIIPRKMKRVADFLINSNYSKKEIEELIENEQSNIDAMASQITSQNAISDAGENTDDNNSNTTLLEALGLEISVVTDKKVLSEVTKLAQNHAKRIVNVYKVINKITQTKFDNYVAKANNKKTELLWHGSRCANWFSIIQQGLKIRPSNAIHTGSMYGDGLYAASEADKSMGYTDSGRWVSNGQVTSKVFMALYDFHLGEQKVITSHNSSCYNLHKTIKGTNYDSVWAKKLYRDEYIVYNDSQCTIKYLVEFSN